jgi:hypothetical protein
MFLYAEGNSSQAYEVLIQLGVNSLIIRTEILAPVKWNRNILDSYHLLLVGDVMEKKTFA